MPYPQLAHPAHYDLSGLEAEDRILGWLKEQGNYVIKADTLERQLTDVDADVNGCPISIKTQHAGEKFGHIYLELATQRYSPYTWEETEFLGQAAKPHCDQVTRGRTCAPGWNPGWGYFGESHYTYILQGTYLYAIPTAELKGALTLKGTGSHGYLTPGLPFLKVHSLSPRLWEQQGRLDTICAYLDREHFSDYLISVRFPCD